MREFPAASIPGKSSAIVGGVVVAAVDVVVAIAVAVVVAIAVVLQSRVTFEQKQLLEEKREEEEETKHWKSISAENELCTFLKIPPPPPPHFPNLIPFGILTPGRVAVHSMASFIQS